MNEKKEALDWLFKKNLITVNQYNEYNQKLTNNENYTNLQNEFQKIYQQNIEVIDIKNEIIEVEDIEKDGIKYLKITYEDNTIKIYEQKSDLSQTIVGNLTFQVLKQTPNQDATTFFTIFTSTLKEIPQLSIDEKPTMPSKGTQKSLGAHPTVGKTFHNAFKEEGFVNLLLFIFLTGISSGIIMMLVLNFMTK